MGLNTNGFGHRIPKRKVKTMGKTTKYPVRLASQFKCKPDRPHVPPRRPGYRRLARSAKTGRIVKLAYAAAHPATTVVEQNKIKKGA